MQSCPKNVNAGSLIGIKASKGPVTPNAAAAAPVSIPNHSHSHHIAPPPSSTTLTPAISSEPIVISSGSSTSSSPPPLDIHSPGVAEPVVTSTTSVATPSVTTSTDVKPESDLYYQYHYPHRPSAPPPTHPLHSYIPAVTAVEVKQEPTSTPLDDTKSATKNIPKLLPLVVKQEITEVKQEPQQQVVTVVACCKKEDFEENGPAMTPDLLLDEALIKKELHHQFDDKSLLSDILSAEANLITSKTLENVSVSNNNSSSISNEKVQLVDSTLPEIPASTVKRRPLLVACKKSTPKKSPPNSYKNLIKRTNMGGDGDEGTVEDVEPTITVLSDDEEDEEEDEDEVVQVTPIKTTRTAVKPRKLLKRTRRVFGAEQLRHLQKLNRTVLKSKRVHRRILKRPSCIPRNPTQVPERTTNEVVKPNEDHVDVQLPEEPPRPMSNVDLTIDLVAKGYFSEPEIVSTEAAKTKSRTLKRLKQQEGRSQSEQNRGKRRDPSSSKEAIDDPLNLAFDSRQTSAKKPKKRAASKTPKHSGKKRATSTPLPPEVPQPDANPLDVSAIDTEPTTATLDDRETDFDDAATMLVDDDMMSVDTNVAINRHNNNNNNSAVENKNPLEDAAAAAVDPLTVEPSTAATELTAPEVRLSEYDMAF